MLRCMRRTNIYLDDRQTVALDEVARRRGTTRADVVRRMIDAGLAADIGSLNDDLAAIDGAFGILGSDDVETVDRDSSAGREGHLDSLWAR